MLSKATLSLYLCMLTLLACTQKHYSVVSTGHEGQQIPSLDLISVDSTTRVNIHNIHSNNPIVLLYFRPECPFCQSEIDQITQTYSLLRAARFVLITSRQSDTLRSFNKRIQQKHLQNLFIGIDYKGDFQDYFNPEATPYTIVYRPNKTLSAAFRGMLTAKQIAQALDNSKSS